LLLSLYESKEQAAEAVKFLREREMEGENGKER
jgi:hypothetical protein